MNLLVPVKMAIPTWQQAKDRCRASSNVPETRTAIQIGTVAVSDSVHVGQNVVTVRNKLRQEKDLLNVTIQHHLRQRLMLEIGKLPLF